MNEKPAAFQTKAATFTRNGGDNKNREAANVRMAAPLVKKPKIDYTTDDAVGCAHRFFRYERMCPMRLFIAIPLPPDITRALAAARVALEAHGATGRFVPRENYHITLHFLGETDDLMDSDGRDPRSRAGYPPVCFASWRVCLL